MNVFELAKFHVDRKKRILLTEEETRRLQIVTRYSYSILSLFNSLIYSIVRWIIAFFWNVEKSCLCNNCSNKIEYLKFPSVCNICRKIYCDVCYGFIDSTACNLCSIIISRLKRLHISSVPFLEIGVYVQLINHINDPNDSIFESLNIEKNNLANYNFEFECTNERIGWWRYDVDGQFFRFRSFKITNNKPELTLNLPIDRINSFEMVDEKTLSIQTVTLNKIMLRLLDAKLAKNLFMYTQDLIDLLI